MCRGGVLFYFFIFWLNAPGLHTGNWKGIGSPGSLEKQRSFHKCTYGLFCIFHLSFLPLYLSSSSIFQMHLKGVTEFILSNLAKTKMRQKRWRGMRREWFELRLDIKTTQPSTFGDSLNTCLWAQQPKQRGKQDQYSVNKFLQDYNKPVAQKYTFLSTNVWDICPIGRWKRTLGNQINEVLIVSLQWVQCVSKDYSQKGE